MEASTGDLDLEDNQARFDDFFRKYYNENILEVIRGYPETKSLIVDFHDLDKYDISLADELISNPDEMISAAERALRDLDLPSDFPKVDINVRFINLPESCKQMISEIRSDHVGKLLSIEGIVRKATDVRPKLVMAAFECKRCGNIIRVEQVENVIKEPFLCEGCDTRGPFKLLPDESKFVDSQKMLMQESLESLRGGEHPKQIRVTLEDDLSGEITPGDRIGVVGILRAVRKRFREKGSRVFDIFIEANSLQPIELEFEEVKISKKDEKKLLKMSKDPLIYDKIRDSIAPHIYGYNTIKEAVMYQLFTSPPIELPDGGRIRGDSHVLILGEPSTGKSEILQHVARELAPRGIYSSGKGTTGAGLCVAPDSLVCLSTGELKPIKELVERELKDNIKKYREGIWIARRPSLEYNAVSLNGGHKSEEKSISQFWRLKSPKKLIRLTTRSGKRIITTATTPFPVIHGGEIIWKEAVELSRGDYVATPRRLVTSKNRNPPLIELVESDPIVYGCENLVKEIVEILTEKYNTSIRGLAKQLDISENNLYFSWVKEGVRGAPRLSDVILLAEKAGVSLEEVVNHMEYYSQYHGHKIKLPKKLNKDFLYFAGLIAGDGDISRTSYGGYSIRFSNSSLELLDRYSSLIYELFGVNFDKSESSEKRPPSIRFHSKIVGEILEKLGIPVSPKSHKVDMSNILLSLPDNLLASFIRGLFDCDGGVVNQDGAGSSYIEFNTTGKKLAKKLHITLLRYEIISMLRKRMVRGRTEVIRTEDGERAIRSLHDRYCITIYGKENLVKFKHCIGFSHPDKKDKLNRVIDNISNAHTNIDTIPYIGKVMKDVRRSFAIPSRLIYGYKNYEYENGRRNPSRSFLQKFVRRVKRNMGGHEERVYVKIEDETKKKLYSTSLEYLAKDELMTLLDIKEHGLYDYFSRKNRTQGIPLAKLKILCDFLEEEGHKELSFKEVGRHTVPRLLDIKTGIKKAEEDLRKLEMLASSDILWDRVTKTEMVENGQAYVYDLTVDGAHNFLVDGIFSHNTATAVKDEFGDGGWSLEAGALVLADKGIACLHPKSKVLVDNRIADIESLFDENNKYFALTGGEETEISDLNAEVVSLNELKSVSKKSTLIRRKKYRGKMLEVTTKSGFKVRLTPDHKLLDGNSLKWKEAKDFRVSDFIVSPLKLPENDEELYLLDLIPDEWLVILDSKEKKEIKEKVLSKYKTLKEFNEKYGLNKDVLSGKNQTTVGTFKAILREFNCYDEWKKRNLSYGRKSAGERLKISKITPELAYFLGFLYGDGHISTNERRSSVSITQSTKNSEQIEQLKRTFENFSNRKLHSYERLSKSKIRGKDTESYNVILYPNSNLIAYLYNYFTKNNLENILRLPDEALKAFIAGALDSDGCISIKRGRKSNKFYETVHVEFLLSKEDEKNKAFMLALRRLDCFGRLIKGINIDRIRITGRTDVHKLVEGIKKYSTKVKDLPPRKHIVSSLSEKVPLDVAAHICSELSDINKSILLKRGVWSTIYNYKNKTYQPSRGQLIKLRDRVPEFLSTEIENKIEMLVNRDYFLDGIKSIEEFNYEGYVYDLFVPEHHNFVCDGIIIHNCVDEFDKMEPGDRSAMHESMEQQSVSIAKAGILATFRARCAILAASNPKFGRFDEYRPISEQIALSPTLLSVDYNEPLMVKEKGKVRIMRIGELVDRYYFDSEEGYPIPIKEDIEVPAFNPDSYEIKWTPVRYVFRHSINEPIYKITLETGRSVKLTEGHSIYVYEDGEVRPKATVELSQDDYVVIPSKLPRNGNPMSEINVVQELLKLPEELTRTIYLHGVPSSAFHRISGRIPRGKRYWAVRGILPLKFSSLLTSQELARCTLVNKGGKHRVPSIIRVDGDLMRLLGYYIADGSMTISSSKSFMVSLSFNQRESAYIEDVRRAFHRVFNVKAHVNKDKNARKVGISDKIVYLILEKILKLSKGAKNKVVPEIVFNVSPELQREFLIGYFRGDRGVTTSRDLMSDVLYLLLQNDIIGSAWKYGRRVARFPDGRKVISERSYVLTSPSPYKEEISKERKHFEFVPYEPSIPILKPALSSLYDGGYGKPCEDPRLGSHLTDNLLHRKDISTRLERLRLLRKPLNTTEAAELFDTVSHREHARCFLQRLVENELVEKKKISGKGKGYAWRYQYALSRNGKRLLENINELKKLMSSDLGFVRIKSIERVEPTSPFVYDLSTPGCENFVSGFGGVVCHNSRFDLIFFVRDEIEDTRVVARHILDSVVSPEKTKPKIEPELLRKYIAYARQNIVPVLTEEAREEIERFYVDMRETTREAENIPIPLTARQLWAIIRLARASARVRLSNEVTVDDTNRAIHLVMASLKDAGVDLETGRVDIDKIMVGVTRSQRDKIKILLDIVRELEKEFGTAGKAEILERADEEGISKENAEELIEMLKKRAELYEPKHGYYKMV